MRNLFRNIMDYFRRYRFMSNGYSEVTGEFGKYYTKPGSNTILFVPERDELPKSKRFGATLAEVVDQMGS